jgi:hypothetical protein
VIDESCSICSSKVCLWRVWMHLLLESSLFFFTKNKSKLQDKTRALSICSSSSQTL